MMWICGLALSAFVAAVDLFVFVLSHSQTHSASYSSFDLYVVRMAQMEKRNNCKYFNGKLVSFRAGNDQRQTSRNWKTNRKNSAKNSRANRVRRVCSYYIQTTRPLSVYDQNQLHFALNISDSWKVNPEVDDIDCVDQHWSDVISIKVIVLLNGFYDDVDRRWMENKKPLFSCDRDGVCWIIASFHHHQRPNTIVYFSLPYGVRHQPYDIHLTDNWSKYP